MNSTQPDDLIIASLTTLHAATNARHGQARTTLLESLANEEAPSISHRRRPVVALRYIVGAVGLSAVAAAVAVGLWLFSGTSPAAAMEQMAQALDQINGYTYRMEMVYVSRKGDGRTVRQITFGSWRTSPVALHATMHIDEVLGTNTAAPGGSNTLVELEESHAANQGGIVVDHLKREYWRVKENIDAGSIPAGSPQVAVHMVQQRRGRVLRDLGSKTLHGQPARGLEIMLDSGQPVSELGPTTSEAKADEPAELDWRNTKFEVWINSQTNLPIEFRCARRGEDFETTYDFTNLSWNVEFGEDEFNLVPPVGYTQREIPEADDKK